MGCLPEKRKADVDEEIGTAASHGEDAKRRKDDGDDYHENRGACTHFGSVCWPGVAGMLPGSEGGCGSDVDSKEACLSVLAQTISRKHESLG